MMQEEENIEEYIGVINDSLKSACIKMITYQNTKDHRTLMDVIHWVRVADIYGRIIKNKGKFK
jgi:hypothetical protein